MNDTDIKELVRNRYGAIAAAAAIPAPAVSSCCAPAPAAETSCCGPAPTQEASSCCAPAPALDTREKALRMGYTEDDLAVVADGANLGLGCGNPQAIAALKAGETVVDLGSGAGFDCFLAARQVGPDGGVIGVDMTHEMLAKARANAARLGLGNVSFRLGELEHLPIADGVADVILSNCVVNLVPDKPAVLREAFRVLRSGGRLAISDVVNTAPLSEELRSDPRLLCGCVSGAAPVSQLEAWMAEAGFTDIQITPRPESRELIATWAPGRGVEDCVVSASIEARKP